MDFGSKGCTGVRCESTSWVVCVGLVCSCVGRVIMHAGFASSSCIGCEEHL